MIEQPAVEDEHFILASEAINDGSLRVLKQGETFGIFGRRGDIVSRERGGQGLYHDGTRFLSHFVLRFGKRRPLFLSSNIKENDVLLTADMMNPALPIGDGTCVAHGVFHLFRSTFLWKGVCYQRLEVYNYGEAPCRMPLTFEVDADYSDIFEVRGTTRERRGSLLSPTVTDDSITMGYRGLDAVERYTTVTFRPQPETVDEHTAYFDIPVAPKESFTLDIAVACSISKETVSLLSFEDALSAATGAVKCLKQSFCKVSSSNEQFNEWTNRSQSDLLIMTTKTEVGWYPYAGIPWYSTIFGRDGIITALECLWVAPVLAQGVLRYLAATQAEELRPERDAEPGKILHETRNGEMAALGEIPFDQYYGTVDATPLFVVLAGEYYRRTGDRSLIESIWPNIQRALDWIDTYGDADGDGFVEYERRAEKGLDNQGWKDSQDSIFHADGSLAQGSIALCEVQGYTYAAKRHAADLADVLGHDEQADRLQAQARRLQQHFEEAFWCEDLGTYAIALDGNKKPCRIRSSNAGHCLFSEIASEARAASVAETLMSEDSYCGWGIRTVAQSEARYSPISYHNGSVWPHDNALIAAGFARYGLKREALTLLDGFFDAILRIDLMRLPELMCGFRRRSEEGPTLYPVACIPQSWASAAVFQLLQAALGLSIDALQRRVNFHHPILPPSLNEVHIQNLMVGEAEMDLLITRHENDVGVNILRRTGDIQIAIRK